MLFFFYILPLVFFAYTGYNGVFKQRMTTRSGRVVGPIEAVITGSIYLLLAAGWFFLGPIYMAFGSDPKPVPRPPAKRQPSAIERQKAEAEHNLQVKQDQARYQKEFERQQAIDDEARRPKLEQLSEDARRRHEEWLNHPPVPPPPVQSAQQPGMPYPGFAPAPGYVPNPTFHAPASGYVPPSYQPAGHR